MILWKTETPSFDVTIEGPVGSVIPVERFTGFLSVLQELKAGDPTVTLARILQDADDSTIYHHRLEDNGGRVYRMDVFLRDGDVWTTLDVPDQWRRAESALRINVQNQLIAFIVDGCTKVVVHWL